jgi:fumarylacetoacetate (FAA) hydrolase
MRGGFGFLHAKPPSTLSAFAVTPDELGADWREGRIQLPLQVKLNGALFGQPVGVAMHFGFGDLIAHAAKTRSLCAGTVIGSGTVSNYDANKVGSACIVERRALDTMAGRALTPYLKADDLVELTCRDAGGQAIFGELRQRVVRHP